VNGYKNDVVVTDGWLGQLIALANAKGDFTAEHAGTKTEGESEGGPAVTQGPGSVDQDSTSVERCSANGDSRPGDHGARGDLRSVSARGLETRA
jgi:hypothetical protein